MLNRTCDYKEDSVTLSIIITTLWNKPNQWLKSSVLVNEIKNKSKKKSIQSIKKYLSGLLRRNVAKDIGLKRDLIKGGEASWRIQPSIKNFKSACNIIAKQGYTYPFVNTEGARKIIQQQSNKIQPLGREMLSILNFQTQFITYPSVFKALFEKPDELKEELVSRMKFYIDIKRKKSYQDIMFEIINGLMIYDYVFNKDKVKRIYDISKQFIHPDERRLEID